MKLLDKDLDFDYEETLSKKPRRKRNSKAIKTFSSGLISVNITFLGRVFWYSDRNGGYLSVVPFDNLLSNILFNKIINITTLDETDYCIDYTVNPNDYFKCFLYPTEEEKVMFLMDTGEEWIWDIRFFLNFLYEAKLHNLKAVKLRHNRKELKLAIDNRYNTAITELINV